MKETPANTGDFEKKIPEGYREGNVLLGNPTGNPMKRIMVGVPLTGLVRAEWMLARYGQVIPCNWSQVDTIQWLDQFSPIDFTVADARNVCAHHCLEQGFDWLFFIDHDVVIPPGTILKLNERMMKGDVPVFGGLYFTKSVPSEPLVYRGRGNGHYTDWELGDEVWVDGLPMGITMIHSSILRAISLEVPEYGVTNGLTVKEIFRTPAKTWFDPEQRSWFNETGTEDLTLCTYIMENEIFQKAGWNDYEGKEFPFLVDTSIYGKHITPDGVQFPSRGEDQQFLPKEVEEAI